MMYVVIRTHDGPENHAVSYIYTPHLVLITITIICSLLVPTWYSSSMVLHH